MIEVSDIRKKYRRKQVLGGVSFQAQKGQITSLIGLNGAGKSTVLKAIMGLTPIDGGSIRIGGQAISPAAYNTIAFIPDRLTMPGSMRLRDGLQFMADFYPRWNPARAEDLMSFFRLERGEKIGRLSKGTAMKFNLVLGMAQDVDYVLMDEPFSGIDLFSRELIAEVFTSQLVEDRGVLITTHEIGDIEHLIDHAVLLDQGRVVRDFDCEQMREEHGKSVIDVMREVYRG
ncbi:ABC transporter ATP-binding protein [Paenibacillus pasadenensis]|uniref:ABC transporter ATP-binding protein n=1 Tax=Paenibacillus pasadenensis TaxID=217090 RepID=A0A2N5N7Z5_9BACL|nr:MULTISPECIES: ABC transporter ATP-binding protein [Paenibacillus]PLT46462.1 ABC transporter ATP-binding protein [Paenibacillus pasadenensis]QGG56888.1 ATP-binding cassette domain-containing protein [Paenibacillus sp. B01]